MGRRIRNVSHCPHYKQIHYGIAFQNRFNHGAILAPWFNCRDNSVIYRRWGDKTSYLKNVKCSGEPKNMAALTL